MALQVRIIDSSKELQDMGNAALSTLLDFMKIHENQVDTRLIAAIAFDDTQLLAYQPVVLQRYIRFLPEKFGSYAVARYEPCVVSFYGHTIDELFSAILKASIKYFKKKALYLEFRHFGEKNIYHTLLLNSGFRVIEWSNVVVDISPGSNVMDIIDRSKRRQFTSSLNQGVEVDTNPSEDRISGFYNLLSVLYHKIRRPLPALQLFLNMSKSGVAKFFIVVKNDQVLAGTVVLHAGDRAFEYYRAAVDVIDNKYVYPSVVAVCSAMQWFADNGGGRFDFMGGGAWNKDSGIRRFKLTFGGTLVKEYRYRKILMR